MSLYQTIAELLQFILPKFYKERYFKKNEKLTTKNFSELGLEPEILWVKNYLSQDSVMMDVGANTGSFIYQLETKLSPQNIFAFEPNKKLFRRLKRIFSNVNIFPIALSDSNGEAKFKVPIIKGKRRTSRGTLNTDFKEVDEEGVYTEKVQVQRLDEWMQTQNFSRIDFIKIDVEGNEMKTLRGATETIQKFMPTLMVEMEQRHHMENIWKFILEIESWGFTGNYLNRQYFKLEKISEKILSENSLDEKNKMNYINNIIFIPKN